MFIINNDHKNDHLEMDEQEPIMDPAADLRWESLASVEQEQQKGLIAEVRRLSKTVDEDGRIESIKKEWEEALADNEDSYIEAEFENALKIYEDNQARFSEAKRIKTELLEESRKLEDSKTWAKTSKRIQEMQKIWREAGFAGQGIDQELWEEFSKSNDIFFNRQNEFFDQRQELQAEAAEQKELLIAEAESHKESSEWKETSAKMRELMDKWKEVGFASREVEDELWERFNGARQHFYQRQHEHFDEMRERHAKAKEIKEGIIEEARDLALSFNFDGAKEKMDELFNRWKEAGSSGRAHEQKLWDQFKSHQDEFYNKFNEYRRSNAEERRWDMEEEAKRLEIRINALEEITDMVKIKLESFESMDTLDEDQEKEQAELLESLKNNEERLDEYHQAMNSLQDELDRY